MEPVFFRSIWISDTHLGGRNLQSRQLLANLGSVLYDALLVINRW